MDEVAVRLKAVRRANGLSQRALARRAGVTNATISMIESGGSSPSVGVLMKILKGVPMEIGAFFTFELEDRQTAFYRADELVEIGRGGVSYRLVAADKRDRALQLLHEVYAPGADSGRATLAHRGEEGGVVISGELEVTVGDETRRLGPGDAYYFDSATPHRFRNPGDAPCVLVSAGTPPSF